MKRALVLVIGMVFSLFLPALVDQVAAAGPPNLILNPSVETADPADPNLPQDWREGGWGTNTATFSYLQTGQNGSRSIRFDVSGYVDGDAKWYFAPVTVAPSTAYTFTDFYKSSIASVLVAQFTDAQGNNSYQDLATLGASSSWKNSAVNFTTSASTVSVTIFHLLNTNGSLTTDNFSLTLYTPPPPSENIVPNPSLESGDAANANQPESWAPDAWGTNNAALTYVSGGHTGDKAVQVSITNYTDGDAKWTYANQPGTPKTKYQVSDYYRSTVPTEVDAAVTLTTGAVRYMYIGTAVPSADWGKFTGTLTLPARAVSFSVMHILYTAGSLTTDDYSVSVPADPLAVSISSSATGSPVSGEITLTAEVTGGVGPTDTVQFKSDGVAIGSPVSTAPYTYAWDTTAASNGTHFITAQVTDSSAAQVTSAAITLFLSNTNPHSGQLLPNNLLTTSNPTNSALPLDWRADSWGTNTTSSQYLDTGHGSAKSVVLQTSGYLSGSAFWHTAALNVTPNQNYEYTDYYKSDIDTVVQLEEDLTDGTSKYMSLGYASPSTDWKQFQAKFSVQNNVSRIVIYHYMAGNGSLTTSDYSLRAYTPLGFTRGLVSLTFDDGVWSHYTNVLPLLQTYGMTGTFNIITSEIDQPGYMSATEIQALIAAGNELASHTVTHPNLTLLSPAQLQAELAQSKDILQSHFSLAVTGFASPNGIYNDNVLDQIGTYYSVHRSVDIGFNSKDNFTTRNIRVQNIDSSVSESTVDAWIDQAASQKTWLVLVYHGVDLSGDVYNSTPQEFEQTLQHLQSLGMTGESMNQALQEVQPQL